MKCGVVDTGSEGHPRHSWGLPLQAPEGRDGPPVCLCQCTHVPLAAVTPHSLSSEGRFAPANSQNPPF